MSRHILSAAGLVLLPCLSLGFSSAAGAANDRLPPIAASVPGQVMSDDSLGRVHGDFTVAYNMHTGQVALVDLRFPTRFPYRLSYGNVQVITDGRDVTIQPGNLGLTIVTPRRTVSLRY